LIITLIHLRQNKWNSYNFGIGRFYYTGRYDGRLFFEKVAAVIDSPTR